MRAFLPRLILGSLLAATPALAADRGYLPAVGPPPLRFALPPDASPAPPVVLPPLAANAVDPAAATPSMPAPSTGAVTAASRRIDGGPAAAASATATLTAGSRRADKPGGLSALDPARPEALEGAESILLAPDRAPAPEPELLTPQMFMKYFTTRTGTNSAAIGVITPVSFVPPQLPASSSSSATFETTPPGKP